MNLSQKWPYVHFIDKQQYYASFLSIDVLYDTVVHTSLSSIIIECGMVYFCFVCMFFFCIVFPSTWQWQKGEKRNSKTKEVENKTHGIENRNP